MIHSRLVSLLNRHVWIQYVIGYLPAMLIGLYLVFYIMDIGSLVSVINANNTLVRQHINMGRLLQVDDYRLKNGEYELSLTGNDSVTVKAGIDDVIYCVKKVGDGYCLYYKEDEFLEVQSIEMIGVDISDVAYVTLNNSGTYTIESGDSRVDLDSIYNIVMTEKGESDYTFEVSSGYVTTLADLNVNFCSALPTDSIYYDELTGSCIRNTTTDFALNFIIGSNLAIIAFSMLAYLILLQVVYNRDELIVLHNRHIFNMNLVFVCSLPLLGVFTFLVL